MKALRSRLRGNGTFSAMSGAVLTAGAAGFDSAFGLDAWLLLLVGIALAAYGVQIFLLARADDVRPAARFATAMDIAWVVSAAVVVIAFPTVMTATGRVTLVLVSLVVAGLAAGQARALHGLVAEETLALRRQ